MSATTAPSGKKQTLTLRDYTDEMLALDALSEMDEGEWTDEHDALADELLAALASKVDNLVEYRATLKTKAATATDYAREIRSKADRLTKKVEWLDRYVLQELERSGRDKMAGEVHALRRQKSAPSVIVEVLPAQLPAAFVRVIPEQLEADKRAIGDALKAGQVVEGCHLEVSYHVRVA